MKIDFEVLHIAQIPDTYLLPGVLTFLEEHQSYRSSGDDGEFICGADIFTRLVEDPDTHELLREGLTAQEYHQWDKLRLNFEDQDIQFIHITKF